MVSLLCSILCEVNCAFENVLQTKHSRQYHFFASTVVNFSKPSLSSIMMNALHNSKLNIVLPRIFLLLPCEVENALTVTAVIRSLAVFVWTSS